jgi:hypothetical protein
MAYRHLAGDIADMVNEQNEDHVVESPNLPENVSVPNNSGTRGHDEVFDPPVSADYECPICIMVLRNPVQTTCGHRHCRGCITRHVE